mgnify:CR=1 FL=1
MAFLYILRLETRPSEAVLEKVVLEIENQSDV